MTIQLFHFDITTTGNQGDNLLFTAVRNTFEAFGDGNQFRIVGSAPLRERVSRRTVDFINAHADAVVIGGGGLFLRDTAPNATSGWQWNIDRTTLSKINVPLIVFAVGNNRFIGQQDFAPTFRRHLAQVIDQSIFVGLRNHGSINTIAHYLDDDRAARLSYQPCPTMITGSLYTGRMPHTVPSEKVISSELIIGRRQVRAGFDADAVYNKTARVLGRLKDDGWTVLSTPFARADRTFGDLLVQRGIATQTIPLYGERCDLFAAIDHFAAHPFVLGCRGHAQMVPFGVGGFPFSAMVHDKIRYLADDIGRPGWVADPRADDYVDTLHQVITDAYDNRAEHRAHLRDVQARLLDVTAANLAAIHQALGGPDVQTGFTPFGAREQAIIARLWKTSHQLEAARTSTAEAAVADSSGAAAPAQGVPLIRRTARSARRAVARMSRLIDVARTAG